jgi:hypothetical protein
MKKTLFAGTVIALWAALAGNAYAQCGSSAKKTALFRPASALLATASLGGTPSAEGGLGLDITGLWAVNFTQGGLAFDQGYDVFHSDGTEILNDGPTVCLGVWARTGLRKFKLHHVFSNWVVDASGLITFTGTGTWDTEITLDKSGNSYTGTFTIQNFDTSGNPISLPPFEGSGNVIGTRITVQ